MTKNRISASLTPEDKQAVLAAIDAIKEKLPFLLGLSPEESKSLLRLGDKSRGFVAKALEVATQNPDFLPRSFDIEEMRKDVELFEALYPITLALSQLQELLDDTVALAGSEAYMAALAVYNYAKATKGDAGLEAAVDDMARRFARKSSSWASQQPES
ncbi:MAG: hypothetical protein GDA38_14830 [Hormoscilla sp. SP12CHS1]|nr:hypothetical protein [Hormoscilla sp. SP12CHS1]